MHSRVPPVDMKRDQEITHIDTPIGTNVKAAIEWFQGAKGSDGLVRKSELSPRAIKRFVHHVWMSERLDDGRYLTRLFSGSSVALAGEDFTGNIIDPSGPFGKWLPVYNQVLSSRREVIVRNQITEHGQWYLQSEVVLFPISDAAGAPRFVLAAYDVLDVNDAPIAFWWRILSQLLVGSTASNF